MSNELLDWLEDRSPQMASEDVAAQLIAFDRVAEAEYVLKMQERIKALEAACKLSFLAITDYDLNGEICGEYFSGAYEALQAAGYGEVGR